MLIWVRDEANCFCATGWTGQISLKLLGKLAFARSVEAWRWTAASTVIKCAVTRCVAGKDASQPDACWAGSRREPRKGMRTRCAKRRLSAFSDGVFAVVITELSIVRQAAAWIASLAMTEGATQTTSWLGPAGHRISTLLRITPPPPLLSRQSVFPGVGIVRPAKSAWRRKGRILPVNPSTGHPGGRGVHRWWHEPCMDRTSWMFPINEGHHARHSRRYPLQWPALPGKGRHNQ